MPSRKVEIFREMLAAFDRGDREAWLANCHEEYEAMPAATFPEAEVVHGREAVWDFYRQVTDAFERVQYAPDIEVIDPGGETLVVHQRTGVRGKASGADVMLDYWIVIRFRDGKVAGDKWFSDRAAALQAAGAERS
jgi:ketosteroid isomerase-like protein